ncbi:transposase, partial [Streptomyces sp. NPDC050388]|uniref:transposase n=1 Tax=Streptomyces sp. NPDC050388 TaxID=3155781 RepID=UPI003435228E
MIGCATAGHHRAGLDVDALRTATARGVLKEGCITHSDRRLPLHRGRVPPHPPARAPRIRLRHPARNQSPGDAGSHPRSVNTRCPSTRWNFTLVRSSGRTVTEVARELGVSAEGLRNWVRQDQ